MNTHQTIINTIKTMNGLTEELQHAINQRDYVINTGEVLGGRVFWDEIVIKVEDDVRRLHKSLGELLEDSYLE